MTLAETQSLFTATLEPQCSDARRERVLALMRRGGPIPPELALAIYANNFAGARVNALAVAYPACVRILGEACFNGIAHRFVDETPSEHSDLNLDGGRFGEFLDAWTATQAQFSEFRYLGDLARLEWLCHAAYYAADDAPFDFTAFAVAAHDAEENLRFQLGYSVGLLRSEYPVMAIREVNLSDDDAAEIQAGELPEHLVVSRPAFKAVVERIDAVTFNILAACREGQTLGQITDAGGKRADGVAEMLPQLIQRGWITGFSADDMRTPGDA